MFEKITETVLMAVPDPGQGTPPPGVSEKIDMLLGWGAWVVIAACVAGIIITATNMAVKLKRGEFGDHATKLGSVLAACILIGSASTIVKFAL